MLDTSTVILLGEISDPTTLPDESVISAITLAELSMGPLVARDDDERGARQQHLHRAEADFEVLPFDADCARAFGGVGAALRSSGRKPTARAYDALIAASAIAHDVALYTCNPDDFKGIPRLQLHPIAPARQDLDTRGRPRPGGERDLSTSAG
jgi:tRNA(fMet)-specific endonuclease VapC